MLYAANAFLALCLLSLSVTARPADVGRAQDIWVPSGLPGLEVTHLVVSPGYPGDTTIFAAAKPSFFDPAALYKSTDGGASWRRSSSGLPAAFGVYSVAISPDYARDGTVYVGGGYRQGDAWTFGVYKTTDRGESWHLATSGLPSTSNVLVLVPDPTNAAVLYAGTACGAYKSTDSGANWQVIRPDCVHVSSISLGPLEAQTLYVAALSTSLVKSGDGGATWVGLGWSTAGTHLVAVSPVSPDTLYVGVQDSKTRASLVRSPDGGKSWVSILEPSVGVSALVFHPSKGDIIVAAGVSAMARGILYSQDEGNTWAPFNSGLPARAAPIALAVTPDPPGILFAGTRDGVWKRLLPAGPIGRPSPDYSVPNGHFYTQTSRWDSLFGRGFSVTNEGGVPFWEEFQRLGGVPSLGYPVSKRFVYQGFTTQAFQKAVMQWQPGGGTGNEEQGTGRVFFLNVFDELHQAGKDDWLLAYRATPRQLDPSFDAGKSWEEIVRDRLALLEENQAIRDRYFSTLDSSTLDPLTLYGLPTSRMEDMGNHYALRLQRAVIQQWKEDVPWARAGEVTVANGGDIAKEAGLFPAEALAPEGPP